MLGVATLIVVNSVMSGFSTKLRERLHGLLSDVVIEANNTYTGFGNYEQIMERIRQHPSLGNKVEAMTGTLEVFAMLQFRLPNHEMMMRPVRLIGVDPKTRAAVGGFQEHLLNGRKSNHFSFDLPPEVRKQFGGTEEWRHSLAWQQWEATVKQWEEERKRGNVVDDPPPTPPPSEMRLPRGIIVGNNIASMRIPDPKASHKTKEYYFLHPGDKVHLVTYKGGDE